MSPSPHAHEAGPAAPDPQKNEGPTDANGQALRDHSTADERDPTAGHQPEQDALGKPVWTDPPAGAAVRSNDPPTGIATAETDEAAERRRVEAIDKRAATLKARSALAGHELHILGDGGFMASRWVRSRHLATADDVERWLDMVGAPK
jgi:hypothetical protein